MPPKQNPFSLYDFLGYFVPGASIFYALFILREMQSTHRDSTQVLLTSHAVQSVGEFVPFVLLSYIVGHILSFVSSVTIERYSIWQVGYPSQYLLGKKPLGYFEVKDAGLRRTAYRVIVAVLLLPIVVPDFLFGRFLHLREAYARALDPFLMSVIDRKIRKLLKALKATQTPEIPADGDFFRLAYHYTVEKAPAHLPKMQNYVALYGFLRTTCMVFVLAWWYVLWVGLTVGSSWTLIVQNAFIGCALVFVLFMAFMKFYRRFSLEVLMALTVVLPNPLSRVDGGTT